jgi:hypothetical protein
MRKRNGMILAVALSASVCAAGYAVSQQFTATLPDGWRSSTQVILILSHVEVPSHTAATLRVYALEGGERGERHLLGSYGLPAQSPDARGATKHERLPIAVTNGLRRWKNAPAAGENVAILVEPVDGKGRPLPTYEWKAREVLFEIR